jgi:RNA-directed DNA polymerase
MAARFVAAFGGKTRPRHRDVVRFLLDDSGFQRARAKYRHQISIAEWLGEPQRMQPVSAAQGWDLPVIQSVGDLANWLSLSTDDLEWFADLKGLGNKLANPKLQHYHYSIRPKRSGGVRLIEMPKPRLKELQRRILTGILDAIPVHPAVHGFVKGHSIVSFAAPHTGKTVVLRLDLQDFFPGFPAARVQALFRTLGYPEQVADRLGGICTNAVPRAVWNLRPLEIAAREWQEARTLYARPHLPQGVPTSPALANLTAYRLDCRLSGLAKTAGALYTRYADDLAFSGGEEFARRVERFSAHAAAVALEEGFHVNHHKTRIMRQGVRQQLAGVVVNQKVNLRRRDLELLEAILTNCVRLGPESQNRDALPDFRSHLQGQVGFVEMVNRVKGQQLRALLDAIQWM